MCQEGEMSWLHRERAQKLCVQDPSRLHPRYLFIWLVPMCTPYNKIVIINVALSWVLWIIIPSTTEPEKVVGNPQFVACQSEVQVAYGSLSLLITSGARAVLLDTLTLNCGFWANSGCSVAKIHGSTRENTLNDTSLSWSHREFRCSEAHCCSKLGRGIRCLYFHNVFKLPLGSSL